MKPDPVHPAMRIKLPESSKPVYRRHTVCGIIGLVSNELKLYDSGCTSVVNVEKRNLVSGEFSFAKSVSTLQDDWRMKLRLRSSSPDLICFNDFKFSLAQESCPLSFLTALLESQV
jgi:hypothetical protein